jgi:leucyl/phenylalanyl-tRNA--protein transferase
MTVYRLSRDLVFPPPEEADPGGLLAVGGDLSAERLLLAYSLGIFPWYDLDQPILWHSPDPRTVLLPSHLHVSRRLRRTLRRGAFEVRLDTQFGRVIRACATVPRRGQRGTWITAQMIEAYERLHELGFAHCAEAWRGDELVGGVYGVSLGGCFFGESMFSRCSDASKLAFATLVRQLERWRFDLVDCQIHSAHLARLGAVAWSRARFTAALGRSLRRATRRGPWRLEPEALDWRTS